MAKKRKADADDDGAAPAKKVHWKAKAGEKSNEIVTRMEALGLQYSKDHEEDEDPQNRSINDLGKSPSHTFRLTGGTLDYAMLSATVPSFERCFP